MLPKFSFANFLNFTIWRNIWSKQLTSWTNTKVSRRRLKTRSRRSWSKFHSPNEVGVKHSNTISSSRVIHLASVYSYRRCAPFRNLVLRERKRERERQREIVSRLVQQAREGKHRSLIPIPVESSRSASRRTLLSSRFHLFHFWRIFNTWTFRRKKTPVVSFVITSRCDVCQVMGNIFGKRRV